MIWKPAGCFRVWGEDAFTYLQSQVSRDLSPLRHGSDEAGVYTLWLNERGKVEGDSFILRTGVDAYLVFSYSTPAELLQHLIERHIIADEVEVDPINNLAGVTVLGGVGTVMRDVESGIRDPGYGISEGRRGRHAYDWLGEETAVEACIESLIGHTRARAIPLVEMDAGFLEWERIGAGIPLIPQDVSDRDTPFDLGLEADAVSFDKGCFLGQEVMAKLHAGGRSLKGLFGLESVSSGFNQEVADSLHKESVLLGNGARAGEVRSVVERDGKIRVLAQMKLRYSEEFQALIVGGTDFRLVPETGS